MWTKENFFDEPRGGSSITAAAADARESTSTRIAIPNMYELNVRGGSLIKAHSYVCKKGQWGISDF